MRALNGRPHAVLISPRRATASQARQTSCISRGLAQQGWPPPPAPGRAHGQEKQRRRHFSAAAAQSRRVCLGVTIAQVANPVPLQGCVWLFRQLHSWGRGQLLQLLLLATWSRRSPLRHFWPQSHLAFLMEAAAREGRKKWGGG